MFIILLFSENDKRFLYETTTSHFVDRNLAAMEAAIIELITRVQHLETANQLEQNFVLRLNQELIAVKSELNATIYRQRDLSTKLELSDFSISKKVLSFEMLFFHIFILCDTSEFFSRSCCLFFQNTSNNSSDISFS